MTTTLAHVFSQLGRPTVALVGDVMLDRYTFGEVSRISPEAPVPVLRVSRVEERLGGAGSVCADLLALEAHVRLVGVVGQDADGDRVLKLAEDEGADVSGLRLDPRRRTTLKNRHIARGGPYGQQVLRVDTEEDRPCPPELESALVTAAVHAVKGADVVLLSDYAKGTLTPGVIAQTIAAARAAGVPVLVDPKGADFSRYRGATALTPNRRETSEATGIAPKDPDSIRAAGRRLLEMADLQAAIITLDRDGMALFTRDGTEHMAPAQARDVFDVTGAGDMVVAVLALMLGCGARLEDAVAVANVAGGLEVARLGSVPLTRAEILAGLGGGAGAGKVVSRDEAVALLRARRAGGSRVVFTNGCFDLLHIGHAKYLQKARALGDLLVVGMNDDASVQRQKGPSRPLMTLMDRAELMASLGCVDLVVPFSEDTPLSIITALEPDVLVKGEDWKDKGVVGREFVEGRGGRVVLMPLEEGRSTTTLVERIRTGKPAT